MKSILFSSIVATLFGASSVAAHGYVNTMLINGVNYTGYQPYTQVPLISLETIRLLTIISDPYYATPPARINRKIPGNGPVTDVTSIDLQCDGYLNSGSAPAPLTAPVKAGSVVSLAWTLWPDTHKGPINTYMAKCPGDCSTYNPGAAAVWFLVAQDGKHADGSWATDLLTTYAPYKFTIPATLAPGNYIIRHEIWALQTASVYPGAQIYPTCIQVAVSGSGTKVPTTNLVAFPGYYTPNTPGIVFDIYNGPATYPIPGPALFKG